MTRLSVSLLLFISTTGCAFDPLPPVASPKGEHPVYAKNYPHNLTEHVARHELLHCWAGQLPDTLATLSEPLKKADKEVVLFAYQLADADGSSAYFADVQKQRWTISRQFAGNPEQLVSKDTTVEKGTDGVRIATEDRSCEPFVRLLSPSSDKAISEKLSELEKNASQAQVYIDEHQSRLKPAELATLRDQVLFIAEASYLVNILLAEEYRRTADMIAEAQAVKETLKTRLDELEASRSSSESEAEKKARNQEYDEIFTARAELDGAIETATKSQETSEQEVRDARAAFDTALQSLESKFR